MDTLPNKTENSQKKRDGFRSCLTDSTSESRETSFSGSNSTSSVSNSQEAKAKGSSSPAPLGWPILKATVSNRSNSDDKENQHKPHLEHSKFTTIDFKMSG